MEKISIESFPTYDKRVARIAPPPTNTSITILQIEYEHAYRTIAKYDRI